MNGLKERKRSADVLDVLEDYIVENSKPNKVMHDNDKQFKSKIFRRFLKKNKIKDKSIPATDIHNYKERLRRITR